MAARATHCFSEQAEIKTKFEVVFCLLFLFYCLFVLSYRNISFFLMFILLTTVKLSNKKNGRATPLSPICISLSRSVVCGVLCVVCVCVCVSHCYIVVL